MAKSSGNSDFASFKDLPATCLDYQTVVQLVWQPFVIYFALAAMATFLYFAYGSNMLVQRLRDRTPSASVVGVGHVVGRRLAFHKVSTDGSGKCDIEATGVTTDQAYGVLFSIEASEKTKLDRAEGVGNGYDAQEIDVYRPDGSAVRATTYVATAVERAMLPYHWYKALVLAGAIEHDLPSAYVEWIRTFHSQQDPNTERRAKNEALLFRS
ncbi:AIG2-like family protein [Solimonas aquatica]|uniref:AIG2-like family protein n=1 Tax=Solimonas aquatica TaxID=489703 RepID=A0A1H9KR97_9GAMM|nr:gamma-glutamylcyclotransferase family protein [Solimonas aquatica]SER01425.1 AIG2-like family protein [Solimonas aquatica]